MPLNGSQRLIAVQITVPRTPAIHSTRPLSIMRFKHAVPNGELLVLPSTRCSHVIVPISVSGHPLFQLPRPQTLDHP